MNKPHLYAEAQAVMQQADCIHDQATIAHALDNMATAITADLADKNPLILIVMNGGMLPASLLMSRLHFPLKMDYLHATRYGENTTSDELMWQRAPNQDLQNRHVLVVDDILDEGYTLDTILRFCVKQRPTSLRSAVLVQKQHDRGVRPPLNYVGLQVPDRYVFGCGMDYKGYWRNLLAIYAVKEA